MYMEDNAEQRQITTTRVINAPFDKVYAAWTDPTQLVEWWGPKDFTNTFHSFDHRPGGHWVYTMHGPNFIGHFENEGVFIEITPNKIVWDRVSKPHFRTIVNFEDLSGQTKITWLMQMATQVEYDKMKGFIPEKNEENMDRLEAFLAAKG